MKNNCKYFENKDCEYFPCHKVAEGADFNCLFCYCPLYRMEDCGGNYRVLESGVKDCSACTLPHKAENYQYIIEKLREGDR